jgi:parallel beta-helix repeat protein
MFKGEGMKRIASGILLMLLLVTMSSLSSNIKPVKSTWTGTVYIRADGSIYPSDAPIITYDNVTYTLTGNITSTADGIVVERDNIIIDGEGYTIRGTGASDSKGINVSGRYNVTIKNTCIKSFYYGIGLFHSSKNSICRNNITDNGDGVWLEDSSNNIMSGNNITNNRYWGIVLYSSSNNNIIGNNVSANDEGISLSESSNNNTVMGNNITENSWYGIYLLTSYNNTLSYNEIKNNNYDGIGLEYSDYNLVWSNIIINNTEGIYAGESSTKVLDNIITGNEYGGISLLGFAGITPSHPSIVSNNVISNNQYGIHFTSSSDNKIYHNNFLNNIKQIYDDSWDFPNCHPSINIWDDGYPSGGNYWSDYTGFDLYSGPYQNETGSDGIGDTPYIIDANNIDHYPLMNYYTPIHNVAIANVAPSKDVVGQSYSLNIYVTVENQGSYTENFNVTLYANTTEIETKQITLTNGASTTLIFTWNTTGFAYGNYTLWAYAWPVQDETDIADNNMTSIIQVHVGVPGNVYGNSYPPPTYDDVCNMRDVTYLILHFNTMPTSPNWDPNTDVNNDGVCNMRDVTIAILNFNKHE